MKKVLLLLLLLITAAYAYSQDKFQPEMSFGVNSGVNISRVSFSPRIPQDMLIQYTGGFTFRYITEKNCGLQAELNYSLRGWKETHDILINTQENFYTRSLAYIELPIMSHFYIDLGKKFRVLFFLGPQLSYLMKEKELERDLKVSPDDTNLLRPYYYDKEVERPFEYGIVGGLGVELRTGIGSFVLDGRFYHSLRDIFKTDRSEMFQKSLNMVIGVKLGYLFQL